MSRSSTTINSGFNLESRANFAKHSTQHLQSCNLLTLNLTFSSSCPQYITPAPLPKTCMSSSFPPPHQARAMHCKHGERWPAAGLCTHHTPMMKKHGKEGANAFGLLSFCSPSPTRVLRRIFFGMILSWAAQVREASIVEKDYLSPIFTET